MSFRATNFDLNITNYSDLIDIDTTNQLHSKPTTRNILNLTSLSKSLTWNNYNITYSLNYDNNIFINIINNSTYQNYEKNICEHDLIQDLTIKMFYTIITKVFESTESTKSTKSTESINLTESTKLNGSKKQQSTYSFQFELVSSRLKINFLVILDEFFPISQSIELDEKILSEDKTLTIKLTEIESKYQKQIDVLNEKINQLENESIMFAIDPTKYGNYLNCTPQSTIFDFRTGDKFHWIGNYMDFNKLIGLKKVILNNNQFTYYRNIEDNQYLSGCKVQFTNLSHICNYRGVNPVLFGQANIFDSKYIWLPNIIEMNVHFVLDSISINKLHSLPNLSKLSFFAWGYTQINSFELVKNIPKLSHLIYSNCLNIFNLNQIKNWCNSKNIKLEII